MKIKNVLIFCGKEVTNLRNAKNGFNTAQTLEKSCRDLENY